MLFNNKDYLREGSPKNIPTRPGIKPATLACDARNVVTIDYPLLADGIKREYKGTRQTSGQSLLV